MNHNDNQLKELIEKLDFTTMQAKMVSHGGWLREEVEEAVRLYRNFLFLMAKYKDANLPPSDDIDEVWHAHILDTKKYMQDCQLLFGEYFHHYPYFGIDTKTDLNDLANAFALTQKLHYEEFGEYVYEVRKPFRFLICWARKLKKLARLSEN